MKVLLFSDEYPPSGGAGIVAEDILTYLKQKGNEVSLITRLYKEIDGVNVYSVDTKSKTWIYKYCNLLRSIDFSKYEYILLNDMIAIFLAGLILKKEYLKRSFCFLHGQEYFIYKNSSFIMKIFKFKKYYTRSLLNCNSIVSVSKFMKSKFLSETNLPLKEKIYTYYIGVDMNKFFLKNCNKKQYLELNNNKNDFIILTVSRVEEKKGFSEMMQLIQKLSKKIKLKWIVIGEGSYREKFLDDLKVRNMIDTVVLLGHIDRDELINYYQKSNIFLLLSNYEEAFGLVYLEAAFSGLWSIGNNNGGVAEAIIEGESGNVVSSLSECEKRILKIAQDGYSKKKVNASVSHFEREKTLNLLTNFFEMKIT